MEVESVILIGGFLANLGGYAYMVQRISRIEARLDGVIFRVGGDKP